MKPNKKAFLRKALTAAFSLVWTALLFLPVGTRTGEAEESYECRWADGSVSVLNYDRAYPYLGGIGENGAISLLNGQTAGMVAASAEFSAAETALRSGGLGEILSVSASDTGRLERAALWRVYGETVWCAGGFFVWQGDRIERVSSAVGTRAVLLSGGMSASALASTGATRLEIRPDAEIFAKTFSGTAIETVTACAPYFYEAGALYRDTAGGRRLLAGIPSAESVRVRGNDFADRGALLPCLALRELTLGFIGSDPYASGGDGADLFVWLFSDGSEFRVPETLEKLRVTGGKIGEHAFYGCGGIREIDLCGMDADAISAEAFLSCTGLRRLHSPRPVSLAGAYGVRVLPCGCLEYTSERGTDFD